MVEQDIARPIAQHLVQRRPRRRRVERRVEQLLDPGGIQVFRRAIPGIAQRPDAAIRRARPRRLDGAHGDLARDRAALGRRAVARELRVPRPRGRRRDLGEPEIRRPAVPLTRFGRDAAIGRDQRKLALDRLLRGEDDAQRRALPGRDRRGQDREFGRLFAGADRALRLRVHCRERQTKNAPAISNDAVAAAASWRAGNNRAPSSLAPIEHIAKALAESWQDPRKIHAKSVASRVDGGPLPSSSAPAPPLVPGKGRSVACGHRRRRGSTPRDAEASSRARRAITFTSGHMP